MTGEIHVVSPHDPKIQDLGRFAVDDYNKKHHALLEFKKVTFAMQQVVSGVMYYLTLEAAEGGKNKVYYAKVWVKPWMDFKEVLEFKPVIGGAAWVKPGMDFKEVQEFKPVIGGTA